MCVCVQPCTNIHFWFARAAESTRKPERERDREREREGYRDRDTDRDKNRETEGAKKHPKPKHVIATQ